MGISVRIGRIVAAQFFVILRRCGPGHIGRKTAPAQEPIHATRGFGAIQMKITRSALTQKTKGDGFQVDVLKSLFQGRLDQRSLDPATTEIASKRRVPRRTETQAIANEPCGKISIVDQTDPFERFNRAIHDGLGKPSSPEFLDHLRPGISAASQKLERRFFCLFDVGVEVEKT